MNRTEKRWYFYRARREVNIGSVIPPVYFKSKPTSLVHCSAVITYLENKRQCQRGGQKLHIPFTCKIPACPAWSPALLDNKASSAQKSITQCKQSWVFALPCSLQERITCSIGMGLVNSGLQAVWDNKTVRTQTLGAVCLCRWQINTSKPEFVLCFAPMFMAPLASASTCHTHRF